MSTIRTNTLSNVAGTQSTAIENAINGSAKAWVNFNGTGTVAINGSFNVSSITDNGTGKYRVNFTTALIDSNYAYCLSTVAPDTSGVNTGIVIEGTNTSVTNKTTTQLNIVIGLQTANTYLDKFDVSAVIFR